MSARKAQQISSEHLAERNDFLERQQRLQQVIGEAQAQLMQIQGEWAYWRRTVIDPAYGMGETDTITEDGKIVRAALNGRA